MHGMSGRAAVQTHGGGNCANALTAAARLGLAPAIVTKLGGDSIGEGIVEELAADGVDTRLVLRGEGPSPFTYIIVDVAGGAQPGFATMLLWCASSSAQIASEVGSEGP